MGPAEGPDAVAGRVARPGMGGVVPRPGLFERLMASARVIVVSAPPGSGKSVLLRSWIGEAGLADRAAWVPVGRGEQDPQRFWLSVPGALRGTAAGWGLVRELTAAPDLDGWAVVERLLKDLAPVADRLWLVIDDVHELRSAGALAQLELLVMRAPPGLRFVLATRHNLRLGLHRLRLEGELAEIRATTILVYSVRGQLELTRGRDADALAVWRAAERLSGHLAAPHGSDFFTPTRAFLLHALVRLGDTGRVEQALAGLDDQARDRGEIRVAVAVLRLAQDDPRGGRRAGARPGRLRSPGRSGGAPTRPRMTRS